MHRKLRVLVFLVAAGGSFGQQASGPSTFEAASIKPSLAEDGHSSWKSRLGNLEMHNVSLRTVILAAYEIKGYQLTGPDWLEKVRFDIVAKSPEVTRDEQLPPLMRALLAERFGLKIHRESKSMPVFALVVGKGGLKIRAVEPGPAQSNSNGTADGMIHLSAKKMSMTRLAEQVSRRMDRPVVDKTGAAGVFDFTLDWSRDVQARVPPPSEEERRPAADSSGPSLFTALQEQLGLRLQSDKAPIEVIVVDHCEKVPTVN